MQDIHDDLTSDSLVDESSTISLGSSFQQKDIYERIFKRTQQQADLINSSVVGSSFNLKQSMGSVLLANPIFDLKQSMGSVLLADPIFDLKQSISPAAFIWAMRASWADPIFDLKQSMGSMLAASSFSNLKQSMGSVLVSSPIFNLNQSLASMAGIFEDYGKSIGSVANTLQYFSSSLDFAGILGAYSSNVNAYINSIPSIIFPTFQRFGERFRQWILAAFERAGLCLAPSMSEDLMYQIAEWSWKGDLRPVTLSVWNYYSRNNHARLRDAVYSWRDISEFCIRWRHYEDALKAHIQELYSSSIRGLMPEIEGIASRFVYVNSIKEKPNRPSLDLGRTGSVVDRMLNVAADIANIDIQTTEMKHWIRVKSLKQYLDNVFYENLDFERNFDHVRNRRKLNRHGSLHGIQIGSVMAMNSLRLFLLLDTIHYILQIYTAKGGVI